MGCVQVFTRNQRRWDPGPVLPREREEWLAGLRDLGWLGGPCRTVSHASYLINLASPDARLRRRSAALLRAELVRCEALSIPLCVVHPGAHLGTRSDHLRAPPTADERAGMRRVAGALDRVHRELPGFGVVTCLETTAGAGTALGFDFRHLASIAGLVRDPRRLGFCFDTCHVTAAGYDMSTGPRAGAVLDEFDEICGLRELRVFHLNDSIGPAGCRRDRHAHIGHGACGTACFRAVVNLGNAGGVPKIIETPKGTDGKGVPWDVVNIRRLKRLVRRPRAGR